MRFAYELADHLGKTVGELLHGAGAPMDMAEWLGWHALARVRNRERERDRVSAQMRSDPRRVRVMPDG